MSFVKCFDVISMVTDEAVKRFSPIWKEDEEKKVILRQYCDAIDSITKEFNMESIEVEVDEITMNISIDLGCDELTIENNNHVFYSLARRAIRFELLAHDDKLVVRFVFPSIWCRA